MTAIHRVTRRKFLRDAGVGAGALIFGSFIPTGTAEAALSLIRKRFPLNNFLSIELDGTIHVIAHRSEMGQGIRSSLAAILIDELEADWEKVRVHQADADAYLFGVPFPVAIPGGTPAIVKGEDAQFVDSSRSMAAYYMPLRLMAAGVRVVLLRATAWKWSVPIEELEARQHRVYHDKSGRSILYQHLLLEARKVLAQQGEPTILDAEKALKPKSKWRFINTDKMPFVDSKDMVTGKAVYGADIMRPGMLTALIERCPVANGKLVSFDPKPALAIPGVRYVTRVLPDEFVARAGTGGVGSGFIPHDGVAVIAENTWAALQGRRAIRPTIVWDRGRHEIYDSEEFKKELADSAKKPGKTVRAKGDFEKGFAGAARTVERDYYVPHLAQTPMEPPAAIAIYENGTFEVWTPTQGPELTQHYLGVYMLEPDPLKWLIWLAEELYQVKDCERAAQKAFNEELAQLLGVNEKTLFEMRDAMKKSIRDKVKVHVTLLGGGFGRKSNPDYAIEAAFLARQYPGTPIRVQWTREDDIKFSFYNACAHEHYEAGLDANGKTTSFLFRSAFTSFFATAFPTANTGNAQVDNVLVKARAGFHNGGEYGYGSAIERSQGLEDMPFHVENLQVENCRAESHIRCGWMRSVANIYHSFGTNSFADELAIAAKRDSKDYLLELIGKGYVLDKKALEAERVQCLDNNLFPVTAMTAAIGGQQFEVVAGYPPDTRRLRAVIERVARESGWDEKVRRYKGTNRGLGIAAHRSFLSYMAAVVDVSIENKVLKINDIWGAIDCGLAVNVDRVRAQMEGGMLYGLSIALLGEITVKNGAVVQNNFDDYGVLRMHHTPRTIHTYIEEPGAEVRAMYKNGDVPPTGVGEPPTPVIAPALCNAIVAAGGPRIRALPVCREKEIKVL